MCILEKDTEILAHYEKGALGFLDTFEGRRSDRFPVLGVRFSIEG